MGLRTTFKPGPNEGHTEGSLTWYNRYKLVTIRQMFGRALLQLNSYNVMNLYVLGSSVSKAPLRKMGGIPPQAAGFLSKIGVSQ